MNNLERMLITNKPITCECGGKYFHLGSGKYTCQTCHKVTYDDFGKVKKLLDENGPMPILAISSATGVSSEIVEFLLKEGRVEIVEGSRYYLECSKCGCSIRSGRFCVDCAKELSGGIQKIFFNEIGEKPKYEIKQKAKMHFLQRKKDW